MTSEAKRSRGRPKGSLKPTAYRERVWVRVPADMRAELERAASEGGLSLSREIRLVLELLVRSPDALREVVRHAAGEPRDAKFIYVEQKPLPVREESASAPRRPVR